MELVFFKFIFRLNPLFCFAFDAYDKDKAVQKTVLPLPSAAFEILGFEDQKNM